jgi:hypothetical protein
MIKEEELKGLRQRLDEKRLDEADFELLGQMIRETKRLRRRLWWMDLAERVLRRMLAVKNWVRGCQGKPPLVPEEYDENER